MMRPNKSACYALYAAMEMARAGPGKQVSVAFVADRCSIPPAVLAKVFQQLVRGGVAIGVRGSGGGYRLAREAAKITVLDVIEAFEPTAAPGRFPIDDGRQGREPPQSRRLRQLFDEVDEQARSTFASVTLETLVGQPRPGMGLHFAHGAS